MIYSSDKLIFGLEEVSLPYCGLNPVGSFSFRDNLKRVMPEMRKQVMAKACKKCGQDCKDICRSGEYVAFNFAQIRFKIINNWN